MEKLLVKDCLLTTVLRVLEEERPQLSNNQSLFAVFKDSIEEGDFCGLVATHDIIQHPDWIFADLTEHRDLVTLRPTQSVRRALATMAQYNVDALPVMEQQIFLGAVTRQSILEKLLVREHQLLLKTRKLKKNLEVEHHKALSWSDKLVGLHEASRCLLTVLSHSSLQNDLLQTGIEALAKLLEARYGAIAILDEAGALVHFVYTGINPETAKQLGQFPQGKGLLGVVIQDNISIRLDDMSQDSRSIGFPEHHPAMKSLLAVPISQRKHVYGRIYLSDKINDEPFSKIDEELTFSFAYSLSLVLDNAREMEEVKRARQSLSYMAHFDALTNLPNRTLLKDRIQQAIVHAQRMEGMIAVLFLDLDNFKLVNDTIGHTLGDALLQKVAQRISGCLRDGDTVARLGGDEFVIMLPDLIDIQDAAKVASKILEALSPPFDLDQHELFVSVSIGISIYPDNAQNMDGLLADADGAMYYAKKLGKNNYQFFTPNLNSSTKHLIKLEKHLRRALDQNEFILHYQPQIDIESGRIIGMEALIRWQSPELGWVGPNDFIPMAEETGLIVSIGAWVIKTACAQAKYWQEMGLPIRVSVNLSSRQFHQVQHQTEGQHPLLETILETLESTGLSPHLLELEFTESLFMQELEDTMEILDVLKQKGVRLSVDDFGTGYSSLSYLKRFPIDTLKIDKSFVNDISTDPNDKAIVAAITLMAQQLKLEVVAEGVETEAQLTFLRELRCHFVQGYYYSKPLPADEALIVLQQGQFYS